MFLKKLTKGSAVAEKERAKGNETNRQKGQKTRRDAYSIK